MPNQVNFRLPDDCTEFISEQSERDATSKTSVIVRALRAYRDHQLEKKEGPVARTTSPSVAIIENPGQDNSK